MRRPAAAIALFVLASVVGCGGSDGGQTRTVVVDYAHDEMATSMIDFFPQVVAVHPGDTVRFRQHWTGEAHNVTFGTSFNDALGRIRARLAKSPRPTAAEVAADQAVLAGLPAILGGDRGPFVVNQNGAQPCYLDEGLPPSAPEESCPKRKQPAFTGRASYYSSGFIPHTGPGANRFDLPLAPDIAPGDYHFYCTLHGAGQSGTLRVVPPGQAIPSQSAVARKGRDAAERDFAEPFRDVLERATDGPVTIAGREYSGPLAGLAADGIRSWTGVAHQAHFEHRHGSLNQFVPAVVRARAGEPVTWTLVGRHTISFNVPDFFPIFTVGRSGLVTINEDAYRPVGFPGRPPNLAATEPARVDAGAWDGEGFRSSGLDWQAGDRYSITFSEPGTYLLACLVHPEMVGRVQVRA